MIKLTDIPSPELSNFKQLGFLKHNSEINIKNNITSILTLPIHDLFHGDDMQLLVITFTISDLDILFDNENKNYYFPINGVIDKKLIFCNEQPLSIKASFYVKKQGYLNNLIFFNYTTFGTQISDIFDKKIHSTDWNYFDNKFYIHNENKPRAISYEHDFSVYNYSLLHLHKHRSESIENTKLLTKPIARFRLEEGKNIIY
jgi:hypothetical protein